MKNLEDVVKSILGIRTTTIVDCPLEPIEIPGSGSSGAYEVNDCMGTIFTIHVPKRGVIVSATYWDLDNEDKQLDLEIFKRNFTQIASEATWSPTDVDIVKFVTELAFVNGDDHNSSYTFDITNIGKAYTAPEGKFYIQAVTRGTPTIAALPRVQLQIQSFDPAFKER